MYRNICFIIVSSVCLVAISFASYSDTLSNQQLSELEKEYIDWCENNLYIFQKSYKLSDIQTNNFCDCYASDAVEIFKKESSKNLSNKRNLSTNKGISSLIDYCIAKVKEEFSGDYNKKESILTRIVKENFFMEINILGSKSGWDFRYRLADNDFRPINNKEAFFPIGEKIKLTHQSSDLIRTCQTSDKFLIIDGIPGYIAQKEVAVDQPKIFKLKCFIDGKQSGSNTLTLKAVSKNKFNDWLKLNRK